MPLSNEDLAERINKIRARKVKGQREWIILNRYAKQMAKQNNLSEIGSWGDVRDRLIEAGLIPKFVEYTS